MAEDPTVQETTGNVALKPDKKGVLTSFFDFFGSPALRLNNSLGAMAIFFFRSFFMIFRIKAIPEIVQQIYFIGAKSAQIVMLVGFFTGMVLGLQLYFVLVKFGSVGVLGTAIALTLIRELGPVMTAIMITARAGSAMTAEIGIQRISEQIDALSTMRIDPLGYLISPRIAAAVISFPILTTFFNLIGILGAWVSGCLLLGVNSGTYFYRVISSTQMDDIMGGYYKSIVFGLLVVTICCFQGFFTHMRTDSYGAKSVSLSTTSAVVFSCVMILISDYIVTSFIV
ncbi:MAG: ABC transporter permease [Deltaproteobacteria bacterium]|jgi:phospholipid/cholesterol/gamma-HCH transport system permease protein|nr:ABC transporter permease [Deltaproteobacteria bacterium]